MSDLKEFAGSDADDGDGEPVLRTGEPMDDGDELVVDVTGAATTTDTDHGDALRVPCEFVSTTGEHAHEGTGEPFDEGEPAVLLTWSKRLARALLRAKAAADDGLEGERIAIWKHGAEMAVDYEVALLDGDDEGDA